MGQAAARMGDMVKQDAPHCHAPIHPPAPTPTPVAHPAIPLAIIKGAPTVMIGGAPAARVTDTTLPCMLPGWQIAKTAKTSTCLSTACETCLATPYTF